MRRAIDVFLTLCLIALVGTSMHMAYTLCFTATTFGGWLPFLWLSIVSPFGGGLIAVMFVENA